MTENRMLTKPHLTHPDGAKRLLRVRAAALYLSVSEWKIRQLVQAGELPLVQDSMGGPWLIDVKDLDAYIERNKHQHESVNV